MKHKRPSQIFHTNVTAQNSHWCKTTAFQPVHVPPAPPLSKWHLGYHIRAVGPTPAVGSEAYVMLLPSKVLRALLGRSGQGTDP